VELDEERDDGRFPLFTLLRVLTFEAKLGMFYSFSARLGHHIVQILLSLEAGNLQQRDQDAIICITVLGDS
jgi:hypothetical protein